MGRRGLKATMPYASYMSSLNHAVLHNDPNDAMRLQVCYIWFKMLNVSRESQAAFLTELTYA